MEIYAVLVKDDIHVLHTEGASPLTKLDTYGCSAFFLSEEEACSFACEILKQQKLAFDPAVIHIE